MTASTEMVSEPVTSERKKSLTGGPGWSAVGNNACASAACGWARDWAGVAGLRLRRGAFSLAGPSQGKTARSGALAQAVKSAAGAGKRWAVAETGLRGEKEEEKVISFLFRIFLQSKLKMLFQLNSKSDFKPSNSK